MQPNTEILLQICLLIYLTKVSVIVIIEFVNLILPMEKDNSNKKKFNN